MRVLSYQLKQLCHRNRDGSYATQAKRMHHLMLIADQLYDLGFRGMKPCSLKQKHVDALVKDWLRQGVRYLDSELFDPQLSADPMPPDRLRVYEKAFGVTLRELVEGFGGGTASGRPVKAVQVGGPLGAYLAADQLDTPMDYEAFVEIDALIGHGGIVVFDDTADMAQQARFAMEFCALESCGKCTPCRIGSTRGVEIIDRIIKGENRDENYDLLVELCDTMEDASLCAMGGMTPYPVRSVLRHFAGEFASENH